jgi:hypothetical protein
MPSTASLAVAGGSGSGLLAWGVRHLFRAATSESCAGWVQEAVEAAHRRCDQTCALVETSSASDWLSFFDKHTSEDWKIFGVGLLLGFCLFLLIDISFIVKEYWRVRVHTWLRGWVYRQPNLYVLPGHAQNRP